MLVTRNGLSDILTEFFFIYFQTTGCELLFFIKTRIWEKIKTISRKGIKGIIPDSLSFFIPSPTTRYCTKKRKATKINTGIQDSKINNTGIKSQKNTLKIA